MVIYVRVIQFAAQEQPPEEMTKYLQIAEQCQRDLAGCGSRSSFVQRYIVVLEELRREARTAMGQRGQNPISNTTRENALFFSHGTPTIGGMERNDAAHSTEFDSANALQVNGAVGEEIGGLQVANLMMQPSMQSATPHWPDAVVEDNFSASGAAGIQDWDYLDSLAIAGLGELDVLFSNFS